MLKIDKYISYNEKIIYKLNKKRKFLILIIISAFLFFLFLLMLSLIIYECVQNIFFGAISFYSKNTYFISCIAFLYISFFIMYILNFSFKHMLITDKNILIRKGISGKLYILDFNDILGYERYSRTNKGQRSYFISMYLKSGKRIKIGNLFINNEDYINLINILNTKLNFIFTSKKEAKEYIPSNYKTYRTVKRNIILPFISFLPIVLALIMFTLYFSGFNKTGQQVNISINGVVEHKSIYESSKSGTSYSFTVLDTQSNDKYVIPISKQQYNWLDKDNKVVINAKKGRLGIVYDLLFSKRMFY